MKMPYKDKRTNRDYMREYMKRYRKMERELIKKARRIVEGS